MLGEYAGLECKTTATLDVRQFSGGEFPEKYYTQCVHYLAVTGWQRWYLAVLVYGKGFFTYTLERDQAEIDALMAAEASFWNNVKEDVPPAPDGSEATKDALQVIYRESQDEGRDLFGRETMLTEYMKLKAQGKAIDERITEIENIIKADLQEAERGSCGTYNITWKSQQRQTFQVKAFAQAYPSIDISPFYKVSSVRPFKVLERKNEN